MITAEEWRAFSCPSKACSRRVVLNPVGFDDNPDVGLTGTIRDWRHEGSSRDWSGRLPVDLHICWDQPLINHGEWSWVSVTHLSFLPPSPEEP